MNIYKKLLLIFLLMQISNVKCKLSRNHIKYAIGTALIILGLNGDHFEAKTLTKDSNDEKGYIYSGNKALIFSAGFMSIVNNIIDQRTPKKNIISYLASIGLIGIGCRMNPPIQHYKKSQSLTRKLYEIKGKIIGTFIGSGAGLITSTFLNNLLDRI